MSRLWKPAKDRVEDLVLADGTPADDGAFPDVVRAGRKVIPSEVLQDVTSAARLGQSPRAAKASAGKAVQRLPHPDASVDDVPAAYWLKLLHEEETRRQQRLPYNPPASDHHAREAGKPWRQVGEYEVQKDLARAKPIAFQKRILQMAQQSSSALRSLWRLPRSSIDGTSLAGTLKDGFYALEKMTAALEANRKRIQDAAAKLRAVEEQLDAAASRAQSLEEQAAAKEREAAGLRGPAEEPEADEGKGKGKGKKKGKKPTAQELEAAAIEKEQKERKAAQLEQEAGELREQAARHRAAISGPTGLLAQQGVARAALLRAQGGGQVGMQARVQEGGAQGRRSSRLSTLSGMAVGSSSSSSRPASSGIGSGAASGAMAMLGDLGGTRKSRPCVRHGAEDALTMMELHGTTGSTTLGGGGGRGAARGTARGAATQVGAGGTRKGKGKGKGLELGLGGGGRLTVVRGIAGRTGGAGMRGQAAGNAQSSSRTPGVVAAGIATRTRQGEGRGATEGKGGEGGGGAAAQAGPEEEAMAAAAGLSAAQLRSMRVYEAALRFDLDALGHRLGLKDGRPFDTTIVGVWT